MNRAIKRSRSGGRLKLRPLALLAVYAALTILATPGLDFLGRDRYLSDESREAFYAEIGPAAALGIAAADLNRALRLPLVQALTPLQRPLRIEQSWNFYQDGPGARHELEIRALMPGDRDGAWTPLYRTLDPELDWLAPELRSRRLAPLVEAMVASEEGKRWSGVTRFVSERLREDHPQARAIELLALQGPLPDGPMEVTRRFVARAPEWTPKQRPPRRSRPALDPRPGGGL